MFVQHTVRTHKPLGVLFLLKNCTPSSPGTKTTAGFTLRYDGDYKEGSLTTFTKCGGRAETEGRTKLGRLPRTLDEV